MAIRPGDIRRKEFRAGFRGYDANQVDDFLDEVADEFERVFGERQRLSEEVETFRGRLEQFEALEDSIRSALVQAEQAASDVRQSANKEAELILREAKERGHRILADSSGRIERVQESYEVLRKAKQEFANDFRRLLKGYLSVMDNVDVASAKEIEASLRERLDLESVATAHEAAETRRRDPSEEPGEYPETSSEGTAERPLDQGSPATPERETPEGERNALQREATQREAMRGEATQRMEAPFAEDATVREAGSSTGPETGSGSGREVGVGERREPEPEVEEPEVDPSSVEESPREQERAAEAAERPEAPEPAEELESEEPMPDERGRAYDEFFDRGREEEGAGEPSGREESKLFKASRFLRRRGS